LFATIGGATKTSSIAVSWSVKAEYLFIDTGNTSASLFGIPFNGRLRDNIGRVGVNYHF
jgi:opacity protein-like surface antigen